MSDLIRREDAYNAVYDYCGNYEPKLLDSIRDAPAVDAVPVKHGRWIISVTFGDKETYARCSVCRTTQIFFNGKEPTNYCPNCGAKMDGEEGDT